VRRPTRARRLDALLPNRRALLPVVEALVALPVLVPVDAGGVTTAVDKPLGVLVGRLEAPVPVGRVVPGKPLEPEAEPAGDVEPGVLALALAWKASKVLSAGAFTAKTIPALQWLVWAQKNQSGVEGSSMVILHDGNWVAPAGTAWKPESTPALGVVMIEHGLANVDCVTVWFLARNSKLMVSPERTVTFVGEKVRPPPSPTRTWRFAAKATVARARAKTAAEKCILKKNNQQVAIKYEVELKVCNEQYGLVQMTDFERCS